MFTPVFLSCVKEKEKHVFSDALEKAISAVMYVRTISDSGDVHVGFVIGKSKIHVAPLQTTVTSYILYESDCIFKHVCF